MINNTDLKNQISKLVGKSIIKVGVGGSTGSIFSLEFASDPVALSEDYYLMVKCAWRLDYLLHSRPVTGWRENSDVDGVMSRRLRALFQDKVTDVTLSDFNDLTITFESSKRLSVFCDITPYVEGVDNWFFGTSEGFYSVNTDLKCIFKSREPKRSV